MLDHCFDTGTMTGLEYLKKFRKQHHSIPVIYHTTIDDEEIRAAATALRIEQYILKDSAYFIRLRAVLDAIHEKVIYKKGYWKRTFMGMFDGF